MASFRVRVQCSGCSGSLVTTRRDVSASGRQSFMKRTLGYGMPSTAHDSVPCPRSATVTSCRGSRKVGGSERGDLVFYRPVNCCSYIRAILKEVNNAVILKEVNGIAAEKPVTKQARQLSET